MWRRLGEQRGMNARRQRGAPKRRDVFVRGAVCACSEAVVQQCRHSEAAVGSLETSGQLRELAARNLPCAMLSQCECFCVACSCVRAFLQPLHVSARATGGTPCCAWIATAGQQRASHPAYRRAQREQRKRAQRAVSHGTRSTQVRSGVADQIRVGRTALADLCA